MKLQQILLYLKGGLILRGGLTDLRRVIFTQDSVLAMRMKKLQLTHNDASGHFVCLHQLGGFQQPKRQQPTFRDADHAARECPGMRLQPPRVQSSITYL